MATEPSDDDLLPVSALNHLLFCNRRAALIHVEGIYVHNQYTLEGTLAHRKVHREPSSEELGASGRLVRRMWLRSDRLRLIGIADVVEFRVVAEPSPGPPAPPDGPDSAPPSVPPAAAPSPCPLPQGERVEASGGSCHPATPSPCPLPQGERVKWVAYPQRETGNWVPYPVEYKRGRRCRWDNDDVQLCAQALCLEEMLGARVPAGAIFHLKSRRRREVLFDEALRARTEDAARRLHELVASRHTPPPVLKPRCRGCSVRELCLPTIVPPADAAPGKERARLEQYLRQVYEIPAESLET